MNAELKKKIDEMVTAMPSMGTRLGKSVMDNLMQQATSIDASPEEKREAGKYLIQAIGKRKRDDIDPKRLLAQCSDFVNLSYIASHYFSRDKSWIYQRINGATVNGKKAAFTQDELNKLASALNEIGLIFLDTSHSIKQSL